MLALYISLEKGEDWQHLANSEYLLCCNYSSSFEDFSILTSESNDFKLKLMESLLITHNNPVLNKPDSSLPLELFW